MRIGEMERDARTCIKVYLDEVIFGLAGINLLTTIILLLSKLYFRPPIKTSIRHRHAAALWCDYSKEITKLLTLGGTITRKELLMYYDEFERIVKETPI